MVAKTYIIAALITVVVIISAFAFNWYFNFLRDQDIKRSLLDLQTSISESQLELLYISEYMKDGCGALEEAKGTTIRTLIETNKKLLRYKEYLIDDTEFKRLKIEQSMLYINYWMIMTKMKSQCNINLTTILYFWDAFSDESKQQGYVLDSITEQYKDRVLVIPLDFNFDLGIIKILSKQFNITKTPTVIVNEKITFDRLVSKKEIVDSFTT